MTNNDDPAADPNVLVGDVTAQAHPMGVVFRILWGPTTDHVDRFGGGSPVGCAHAEHPHFRADQIHRRNLLPYQIGVV